MDLDSVIVCIPLPESLRLGHGPDVGLRGDLIAEEAAEGQACHGEAVPGEHPLRRLHHQSSRPRRIFFSSLDKN
ncbi:myb-related protein 306 isoform X1 [Iris pallida]|uniref:Myb-related protein 306 isoform X1 n=1 Tax=Iris pallida TaxID=29817 RepID=A0AAX6IDM9_IRIPA|nr:myb-related protein 306 isoform X1 [Iris pallida]